MPYGYANELSCVGAMLEHYRIHMPKSTHILLS